MMRVAKYDAYACLSDNVGADAGEKRVRKSCERTLRFLDETLALVEEPSWRSTLVGVIQGGPYEAWRVFSSAETAKRPVAGILFVLSLV